MSNIKSLWNKGVRLLLSEDAKEDYYYSKYFNELSLLALNRFTWSNLPNGIESRHIEQGLFKHGQVGFFEREEGGIVCLPCSPNNQLNIYGDPRGFVLTGIGYNAQKTSEEIIRIMNNDLAIPTSFMIDYYSQLLAEVDRTSQTNLKQQKFPFIISMTKDNELSMKNIFKKLVKGETEIMVDSKLSNGGDIGINCINTNVPYIIDKLRQEKNDVVCEVLTLLGLNNSNANNGKKERLLVDEVNVNNGQILMNLELEFKHRKNACKLINEKFGLNVSVEKTILEIGQEFSEGGED